jgi:hypothetical protein
MNKEKKVNWASPLEEAKKGKVGKKEEKEGVVEKFKKEKCCIPAIVVKKATGREIVDELHCRWLERWVEQLVRERSYPPQLLGKDFYALLATYFDPKTVGEVLEKVRKDFRLAFPLLDEKKEDDLEWITAILNNDRKHLDLL